MREAPILSWEFWFLFILLCSIALFVIEFQFCKNAVANFKNIAGLLKTKVRRPIILPIYFVVQGIVEGREIKISYCANGLLDRWVRITIKPLKIFNRNKWKGTDITRNTRFWAWDRHVIEYCPRKEYNANQYIYQKKMSREEILSIFNELTEAAKIVETAY